MSRQPKPAGELALIQQIRRDFSSPPSKTLALGIGDDCAILRPPPHHDLLVTTDFSLEGRHFRRDRHPPESAGHRCLARGLSDLAAMGATPIAAFLSLALPSDLLATAPGRRWLDRFFLGLRTLAELYDVPLAGGDTSSSPTRHILADIVLTGSAPSGQALRRSTAQPGDLIYVTGNLGGASAELATVLARRRLMPLPRSTDNHPHLFPEPRLDAGEALLRRGIATSCIDISDGFSTDLAHLCRASAVRAELDLSLIPIHPIARKLRPAAALHAALHGGEDYELLFTAPHSLRIPSEIASVPITRIGEIKPRRSGKPLLTLITPDGTHSPLEPQGWEHLTG